MKNAELKIPKNIFNKVKSGNRKFNKYLVQIAEKAAIIKKLTMHKARHSFGNISGDKIPIVPLIFQIFIFGSEFIVDISTACHVAVPVLSTATVLHHRHAFDFVAFPISFLVLFILVYNRIF